MKSKLLTFIAAIAASTGVSVVQAQTDVTNLYITNPSFETSPAQKGSSVIVEGWNTPTAGNYFDIAIEDGNQYSAGSGPSTLGLSTPSDGTKHLAFRKAWDDTYVGTVSQSVILPAGRYYLSCDYKLGAISGGNAPKQNPLFQLKVTQNDNTIASSPIATLTQYVSGSTWFSSIKWSSAGTILELPEETSVNIEAIATTHANQHTAICLDNFRLYSLSSSTNNETVKFTGLITNPSFETGDNKGWTNSGFVKQNNNTFNIKDGTYYFERWQGSGGLPDSDIHQTLSALPNGYYTLTAAAGFGGEGAYLYANKDEMEITNDNIDRDYKVYTKISDGNLTIGMKLVSSTSNYMRFDNFRLAYSTDAPEEFLNFKQTKLNSLIQAAQVLKDAKMQNSISTSLNQALSQAEANSSSTDTDILDADIQSLSAEINKANASITNYSALKTAIDEAIAYKAEITTPSNEAQNVFQQAIDEANIIYTDGNTEVTTEAIATLNTAKITYMYAQPAPADYTALMGNPSFENGFINWEKTQNSTDGYGDGVNAENATKGTNSYFYRIDGRMRHATIYQTIKGLKAGVYAISADVYGNPASTIDLEGTFVYATTGTVDHWAASKAECFKGYIKADGLEKVNEWENLSATFTLAAETDVRIGILSWGYNVNDDTEKHGAFRADNFILTYLGEGHIETVENAITANGNVNITELNNALTETITSLDATEITSLGELIPTNPNTIVYGLPAGVTLQQGKGISEGSTTDLSDVYSFHAPKALAATISYTRAFNMNGAPCNQTNGNWQTICLPFDVTAVKATQSGNEISLIPISGFTGTEGTNDPRPFWVYEIGIDNKLNPATEMKANVPYLVAIPNDASTYRDFYNVSGDVVFSGTQILVTNPETGNTDTYSMTANFTPIAANTNDYGINAEGTYFVPSVDINSFNAKVTPVGTGKPAYLSIFGDEPDVTALPSIPSAELQNGIEVYTTSNGITIQSEKETFLSIFAVTGKLVKEIRINEGLNYVTLPIGQYVINGSVIIVK